MSKKFDYQQIIDQLQAADCVVFEYPPNNISHLKKVLKEKYGMEHGWGKDYVARGFKNKVLGTIVVCLTTAVSQEGKGRED